MTTRRSLVKALTVAAALAFAPLAPAQDAAPDQLVKTVTLEVTGSNEKVEKFVSELQQYGVREVARTGSVAMIRGEDTL